MGMIIVLTEPPYCSTCCKQVLIAGKARGRGGVLKSKLASCGTKSAQSPKTRNQAAFKPIGGGSIVGYVPGHRPDRSVTSWTTQSLPTDHPLDPPSPPVLSRPDKSYQTTKLGTRQPSSQSEMAQSSVMYLTIVWAVRRPPGRAQFAWPVVRRTPLHSSLRALSAWQPRRLHRPAPDAAAAGAPRRRLRGGSGLPSGSTRTSMNQKPSAQGGERE
jgi:hypothetical protein